MNPTLGTPARACFAFFRISSSTTKGVISLPATGRARSRPLPIRVMKGPLGRDLLTRISFEFSSYDRLYISTDDEPSCAYWRNSESTVHGICAGAEPSPSICGNARVTTNRNTPAVTAVPASRLFLVPVTNAPGHRRHHGSRPNPLSNAFSTLE